MTRQRLQLLADMGLGWKLRSSLAEQDAELQRFIASVKGH